jgi:hypothetical protein
VARAATAREDEASVASALVRVSRAHVARIVRTRTSSWRMSRTDVTARFVCPRLPSILPGAFAET